jgi:hypothetical protein
MARAQKRVKERRWVRLLREKRASGESVVAFCSKRQIPVHQFYWWQRKLSHYDVQDVQEQPLTPARFVPVRVSLVSPTIEVVHPGGCIVRVIAGVEFQALRTVFAALEGGEA